MTRFALTLAILASLACGTIANAYSFIGGNAGLFEAGVTGGAWALLIDTDEDGIPGLTLANGDWLFDSDDLLVQTGTFNGFNANGAQIGGASLNSIFVYGDKGADQGDPIYLVWEGGNNATDLTGPVEGTPIYYHVLGSLAGSVNSFNQNLGGNFGALAGSQIGTTPVTPIIPTPAAGLMALIGGVAMFARRRR